MTTAKTFKLEITGEETRTHRMVVEVPEDEYRLIKTMIQQKRWERLNDFLGGYLDDTTVEDGSWDNCEVRHCLRSGKTKTLAPVER